MTADRCTIRRTLPALFVLTALYMPGSASADQTWAELPPPTDANAPACGPRDLVIARLAATYGETRQSIGLGSNNAVMEVFASDETGSWTITVTGTDGVTCLVASGLAFERLHDTLPPDESDA